MRTINIKGKEIVVCDKVFEPYYTARDDTLFNLPELNNCRTILDMGTGTGILPIMWVERYPKLEKIYAVDKYPNAVANAKLNIKNNVSRQLRSKITVIQSDLFENVPPTCQFDAIVFNAPHINYKRKEVEQIHRVRGDELHYSDFDPGLEIAGRFFHQASKYLKQDGAAHEGQPGFIIYTFSDYGDIEKLFEVIKQNKWVATLISTTPFQDRGIIPNFSGWRELLWYNLKVQRPQYCSASVEEVILSFQETIHVLFDSVKPVTCEEEYKKIKKRTIILLRGLTQQIGTWLAFHCQDNCWITCGFPIPSWDAQEFDYEFFTGCDPKIDTDQRESFDTKIKKFTKILEGKLGNQIEFIVDYLPKSEKYDVIEAVMRTDIQGNSVYLYPTSGFEKVLSMKLGIDSVCDIDVQSETRNAIEEDFQAVIGTLDLIDFQDGDKDVKIALNAFLNFYVLTLSGQPLQFMYFKRYRLPTMGQDSTIYFFSSIPRDDSLAYRVMLRLLEVYRHVGMLIQEPIWRTIRQKFALQSAVAAIMARNMSHNIGSHVLAYYDAELTQINDRDFSKRRFFNRYLQARMDYIAYVTTMTPVYGNGLSLKDIEKEFNSNPNEILRKGLIASEKFGQVKLVVTDNYNRLLFFPMGELGKQAFFNIIEAIARNTAKYCHQSGNNGTLNLNIEATLNEKHTEYVKITIWDPSGCIYENAKKELKLGMEDDARYHKLIDNTGLIQDAFWGIKEMRISAAFLRKRHVQQVDEKVQPLFLDFEENKEGKLCQVINMLMFKYLLIVTQRNDVFIQGKYIDIVSKEKVKEVKAEYKMCVIENGVVLSKEETKLLPIRRLENVSGKFSVSNEDNEKNQVLNYYKKWITERAGNREIDNIKILYDHDPVNSVSYNWNGFICAKRDPENLKGNVYFGKHLNVNNQLVNIINKCPLSIQDVSGSTQWLKTKLNNPPEAMFEKEVFSYEIKESALESVIILDERLWRQFEQNSPKTRYYQKGQQVTIGDISRESTNFVAFQDLNKKNIFTIKKKNTSLNILMEGDYTESKFTFACFHLGMLDKISKKLRVNVDGIVDILKKSSIAEHLIVHSGRGKTLKSRHWVLYMDYSSLQVWVKEGKVLLIQGLYSLKPLKPEVHE